ncbi:ribosome recycling factor [Candidatus Parcubacteria bacterium]|nr:ribosome recycling factor [Candidatus Parcubacteria bacterium]
MTPEQSVKQAENKFQAAAEHFKNELKKLRTGRAHPDMLESLKVDAYGSPMPLIQVATITTPEPQLLQIRPFDPNNLQSISDSIRNNPTLGMNPSDDGQVVRVQIPPLTEERRREIVKQLNIKVEECMIAMRNARHEAMREIDQAKKDKQIGEDEQKRYAKQIDDLMTKVKTQVELTAKTKEQEILTI